MVKKRKKIWKWTMLFFFVMTASFMVLSIVYKWPHRYVALLSFAAGGYLFRLLDKIQADLKEQNERVERFLKKYDRENV